MIPVAVVLLIIAAIVGCVAWIVAYTVREYRATRRDGDEADLLAPHREGIEQQELDRLVNAAVLEAHRAYYRESAR